MYNILFEKSAQKNLYSLPKVEREKIFLSIQALSKNPRPNGYKKLAGRDGYRIRIGNYRVIYIIRDNVLTIVILNINHRKTIYR